MRCFDNMCTWGRPRQSSILSKERLRNKENHLLQSPQVCASVLDLAQYMTPVEGYVNVFSRLLLITLSLCSYTVSYPCLDHSGTHIA
jgi:hypothetical protein